MGSRATGWMSQATAYRQSHAYMKLPAVVNEEGMAGDLAGASTGNANRCEPHIIPAPTP